MKKIIFAVCLLFPLGLYVYGKVSPMMHEANQVKQVTEVVRQIPMDKPVDTSALRDAFKHFHRPVAPKVAPKAPVKPSVKPKAIITPRPVAPAPVCKPPVFEEKPPTEFCALGWLSAHCGFSAQ